MNNTKIGYIFVPVPRSGPGFSFSNIVVLFGDKPLIHQSELRTYTKVVLFKKKVPFQFRYVVF